MDLNKKNKIAFLITGLQAGGAERVISNLANNFAEKNYDVKIIVMKKTVSDYALNPNIDFAGADAVGKEGKNNFIKGLLFYIKQIKNFKPDVIVSFLPKTIIISMLCKILFFRNIPVIVGERANPVARKNIIGKLNDILFKKADGCVFQTSDAKKYYNIIDESKQIILKNPVSSEFDVEPFKGERKKVIVTAGRLSEQKNHELLIEAFSKVKDKFPEYKLVIYGDGPLKDKLQNKIEAVGGENNIILAGRVNQIIDKIHDASLFVLSSNFEGMPNALLEAMSLGLPCISTDCPVGGPREIIVNNENGVLVKLNNADDMANAIDKILSDREFAEKIGNNANKIYNQFSVENVCNKWEAFVIKIMKKFYNK